LGRPSPSRSHRSTTMDQRPQADFPAESRGPRRRRLPEDAIPSSPTYSGSGPRMSILYFVATTMSFAISGGVKSLKGTLSSKTKCSNPAGAHSSSIRAGREPTTLKAVGDLARAEDVGARSTLHPLAIADKGHFAFEYVKRFVFQMMHMVGRSKPGRHLPVLHQPERSIGRFGGRPHEGR